MRGCKAICNSSPGQKCLYKGRVTDYNFFFNVRKLHLYEFELSSLNHTGDGAFHCHVL